MKGLRLLLLALVFVSCGKESSEIKDKSGRGPVSQVGVQQSILLDEDGDGLHDDVDELPSQANFPSFFRMGEQLNITVSNKNGVNKSFSLGITNGEVLENELFARLGDRYLDSIDPVKDYGADYLLTGGIDSSHTVHEALKNLEEIKFSKDGAFIVSIPQLLGISYEIKDVFTNIEVGIVLVDMNTAKVTEIDTITLLEEFESYKEKWIDLKFRIDGEFFNKDVLKKILKGELRIGYGIQNLYIAGLKKSYKDVMKDIKSKCVRVSTDAFGVNESRRMYVSAGPETTVQRLLELVFESGFKIDSYEATNNGSKIILETFEGIKEVRYLLSGGIARGLHSRLNNGDNFYLFIKNNNQQMRTIIKDPSWIQTTKGSLFINSDNLNKGELLLYLTDINMDGFKLKNESVKAQPYSCGKDSQGKPLSGWFTYQKSISELFKWIPGNPISVNFLLEHISVSYDGQSYEFKTPGHPEFIAGYSVIDDGIFIKVPVIYKNKRLQKVDISGHELDLDMSGNETSCKCGSNYVECNAEVISKIKGPIVKHKDIFGFNFSLFHAVGN